MSNRKRTRTKSSSQTINCKSPRLNEDIAKEANFKGGSFFRLSSLITWGPSFQCHVKCTKMNYNQVLWHHFAPMNWNMITKEILLVSKMPWYLNRNKNILYDEHVLENVGKTWTILFRPWCVLRLNIDEPPLDAYIASAISMPLPGTLQAPFGSDCSVQTRWAFAGLATYLFSKAPNFITGGPINI